MSPHKDKNVMPNNIETITFCLLHFLQFTSKKSEVKKLKSMCLNSLNSHPLLTKEFALTFWSSKALRSLM